MKLKQFIFAFMAMLLCFSVSVNAQVAKVGNAEYATIDDAIANWTNGTTLTLLANVTLSDVVTLKSTEHHTLDLGTYTMTAASGKNAFVIQACGTGDAERTAITINADATNPGGINAGNKCVVYYKYADGGISGNDRPIIKINGGVFTGSTSSWGTAGIYTIGTAARKCATLNITGGTFNCSINGSGKSKLIVSGGVFNYSVGSQGDSTALRLISGGTFKTFGFMTADSNNTKFWFGTSMGNSNVGVYVDDNGYIVVGGPVNTEAGDKFEASSENYSGANSLLQYSSAKDNGLYYTSVEEALADNNISTGSVTVYVDELDMTGISYKGTIVVPEGNDITITNAPSTLKVQLADGTVLTPDSNGTVATKLEVATLAELQAALASTTNVPIVITAQIEIPADKTVELDLNGKTVNSVFNDNSTTNHIYALSNKGTLTIKDSKGNGSINSRGIYNYGSLTLNAGAINAIDGNGGYAVNNQSGSTFVMNGGVVAATYEDDHQSSSGGYDATALKVPAGCTATLNGGTINNVCDFTYAIDAAGTLDIPETSTITVNGTHGAIAVSGGVTTIDAGTFQIPADNYSRTDNVLYVSGGSLVVNGGTFIGDSDTAGGGSCLYDAAGKAVVNGGTFKGSSGGDVWGTTGTTIKGGTFENLTEKQHIAPGYELGTDGTVVAKSVASINGTKYTSLAEAVDAAQNGETITLIDNVVLAERVTIPADKTLTIDLNGKSISMEESIITTAYAINNLGNLTITDGASGGSINARGIYNGYGDGGANVATAKITVLSGTINAKGTNGGGAAIFNYGVADIQGGTFTSVASYAIALQTGSTMTIDKNAIITGGINSWQSTLTITGGAISNDKSGKHVVYAGESAVTINGGTFHNNNSGNATIMASGSTAAVKITDGTFTLNIVNASSSYLIDATSSATYTISGGSFTGGIRAQGGTKYEITGGTFTNEYGNYNVYEGGDINIFGGTFTGSYAQKFATDNLADDYKLGEDGKVVYAPVVAKIGETKYETLEAAFAAATEGQTITMLVDATPALTSQRAITKAAVIDLGGKTMTLKEDDLYFGTTTFKNGTIVVDPSVKPSTAVFWMFAKQTLTFNNVKVVSTGVTGTYLIGLEGDNSDLNLLNGSEILVENTTALDLDIICVNGTNTCDIKVENSKVNVTNIDGRVFFRGNYTVKDSEVNLAGITKAGFRIEAGQKLSIEGTSVVNIAGEPRDGGIHLTDLTATYTKAETATVNATVNEPKVAKVGDKTYRTLAQAVAAVEDGGTITLIANETFTENNRYNNGGWWDGLGYSGDKSFTIDLAGFTISQDGALNDYLMWFKNDGAKANTITLKNGTLDAGTTAYCALATASSNVQKITVNLENIQLINNNSNGATLKIRGGAELNANAGTIITGKNSYVGIEAVGAKTVVNIYEGTKIYQNGKSSSWGCLAGASGNSTINVYGGEGTSAKGGFIAMTSGGTINISGGEWTANTDGTIANDNNGVLIAQSDKQYNAGAGNSIVNVTGGTFKGGYNCYGNAVGDAQINIKGGNFNADPTSYVAEDYIAVKNNGVWNVAKAAAKIGKQGYATVDAAIKAAQAGETVTIFEGTYKVPAMKAGITVVGEGEVLLEGTLSGTLENLTLKNLHIKGGNAQRWAYGKGNLVFENVTFEATSVYALHFDGITAGTNLTYKDCTIIGWAAMGGSPASCVFDGCTIKGNGTYGVIRTYFDTTIKGCTFDVANVSTTDAYEDGIHAVDGAKVVVNECTNANGDMKDIVNVHGTSVVTIDGKEIKNAAKAGNKYYATFEEAFAAVQAGETLTLLADLNLKEILTINKAITFDGNGKTLTSSAGRAINVSGADGVTIKNLTINASGERAINVIQNATNVTIDKVTATAANYTVNVAASAPNAVVAIKNSTLNGLCTVNVSAAGAQVTVDNSTVNCNDNNTTVGESYAALSLNKEAVGGSIVATNSTINVTDGSDSVKGRNGAENGTVTINGSTEGVAVMVAAITYPNSDNYHAFATLKAAIEFAKTGDVITLIQDVTMDYNARDAYETQAKNVVIDGNGKTLTLNQKNSDWASFGLANNSKLVLKNMTIEKTGYGDTSGAWNTHAIIFSCPVEMNNVTVNNSIAVQAGATLTNVTINEANVYYGLWINGNGQEVTINGGAINANKNGGRGIKIADQYIDAPAQVTLSVDGTVFTTAKKAAVLVSSKAGANITASNVNIENVAEDNVNFVWVDEDWAQYFDQVEVNGATVSVEGAGSFAAAITANGAVQAYYKTLAEAINAAQAGETITLLQDVKENVIIKKHLTIEGAGKTITGMITTDGKSLKVTIKNVNFNGNNKTVNYAMRADDDLNLVVENCSVKDYLYGFLYANKSNDKIVVKNVTVENCASYGAYLVSFNSASFEDFKVIGARSGILVDNSSTRKVNLKNVTFEGVETPLATNDKGTSIVTFAFDGINEMGKTAFYSNFAKVVAAAQVDTKVCGSLQDAVVVAKDGDTVKVLDNLNMTTANFETQVDGYATLVNVVGKAVTIDLNGKTVTVNAAHADLNGKAKGNMLMSVFHADPNGTLTLTDSSAEGKGTVELYANDATVYGLIVSENSGDKTKSGKIVINGGNYIADKLSDSMIFADTNEVITVNGGNFTLGNVGTGANGKPWIFNTLGNNQIYILVNGGTFNADVNHQYWAFEVSVPETKALQSNGDGTWTVVDAVAYVTEKYNNYTRKAGYATLEDAIASKYGNEVTLLTNIDRTQPVAIPSNKVVTLNLNGKTIAGTDEGTASFGLININPGAELTINGKGAITLTATNNRGWNAYSSVISNQRGKLTVNGGTIEHFGGTDMAYAIDNLTNTGAENAETEINGGIVKSTYRAIRQFLNSTSAQNILTVNGGTIEGANKSIWMQEANAKANPGTLTVTEDAELYGNVYISAADGATELPVEIAVASAALKNSSEVVLSKAPKYYYLLETNGVWGIEYAYIDRLDIVDGAMTEFVNQNEKTVGTLTYTRSIKTTWTPFYVPFAVPVSALADKFDVAYINAVRRRDGNSDGVLDSTFTMEIIFIHCASKNVDGSSKMLKPNYPYFIRSNSDQAKTMEITLTDATLYAAKENTFDCTTMTEKFEIKGNYHQISSDKFTENDYIVGGGVWGNIQDGSSLNPFRFYMTMSSRDGSEPTTMARMKSMKIVVCGEEDENGATIIYDVVEDSLNNNGNDFIYDLQGRRVSEPKKGGIYIKNGKKILY